MKYHKITIFVAILTLITVQINNVDAHPGRTDSSGCHTCRTNCESWGLSYGEYHCHNSGSSGSNNTNNSNIKDTNSEQVIKIKKSSNAKLERLSIDGDMITINKTMEYETDERIVMIETTPVHSAATVEISEDGYLQHGKNEMIITVIAEDGTKNKYNLNIVVKNSNAEIGSVTINNEEITLSSKNSTIEYETYEDSASIEVTPKDEYATVYYDKNVNLKEGNNEVLVKIVAENGNGKEYIINIEKQEEVSDLAVIFFCIFCGVVGIIICIKYNKIKNQKNTSSINICTKCNKQIEATEKYCSYCGNKNK